MKIVNGKNLGKSSRWSPNLNTTEDTGMKIALSESLQEIAFEMTRRNQFEEKAQKYLSQQSQPFSILRYH
jgi:hypothetical protein